MMMMIIIIIIKIILIMIMIPIIHHPSHFPDTTPTKKPLPRRGTVFSVANVGRSSSGACFRTKSREPRWAFVFWCA